MRWYLVSLVLFYQRKLKQANKYPLYKNLISFRLVFGRVADHPQVNCVVLQQLALVVIGSCTMLLVAAQYFGWFTFYALVIFILFMGIFDGCFITMFGPIAYKICGPQVWSLTQLFRVFFWIKNCLTFHGECQWLQFLTEGVFYCFPFSLGEGVLHLTSAHPKLQRFKNSGRLCSPWAVLIKSC